MKVKLLLCAFSLLFALPLFVRAEEVEIPLMVVLEMESIGGFDPLDNSEKETTTPPPPTSFRASINGNSLVIEKQDEAIPSAQATIVNASTGNVVLNQPFTDSLQEQVASAGVYVLRIETAGGALTGRFIVE
jgi:hypothetical protein